VSTCQSTSLTCSGSGGIHTCMAAESRRDTGRVYDDSLHMHTCVSTCQSTSLTCSGSGGIHTCMAAESKRDTGRMYDDSEVK